MISLGLDESVNAWLCSINAWAVSILVMYFSFKSDRTDTRFGRRIPYLLISTPFIAISALAIPFVSTLWMVIVLSVMGMFFSDMKASTYPLLSIDCVRRDVLARVNSIGAIVGGVVGFIALRWGIGLVNIHPLLPYAVSAVLILGITLVVVFGVKEPPIRIRDGARFRLWSTFAVVSKDRRILVLMLGVALLNSMIAISNTWLGFYILKVMKVSAVDYGRITSWASLAAILLAYPAGYIIDRFSGYKVVCVFWVLQILLGLTLIFFVRESWLPFLFVWSPVCCCLNSAANMMIWKSCPPEHVGSYTSSAAFFNNILIGTTVFLSGRVLAWSGNNYSLAYILGMVEVTAGLALVLLYRHLMRRGAPAMASQPATWVANQVSDPKSSPAVS
jgi:Na+/melibiose symporter-like transporter